jgi:hypothetical protein
MTNPKIAPWQAVFRTIDESGYTSAGDVLLYVAAVGALKVRGSCPGASCSITPDHALQTPQPEWTNLIVVRGIVLIFGHRHRLVAGRENIPYATLATPNIFVQQLETYTIHRETGSQTQWIPRWSRLGQCPKRDHELPSGNVRAQSASLDRIHGTSFDPPRRRGREFRKLR